jgi:hypothetical protein
LLWVLKTSNKRIAIGVRSKRKENQPKREKKNKKTKILRGGNNMKKALIVTLSLLLSISIVGCTVAQLKPGGKLQNQTTDIQNNDEAAVKSLVESVVENFGKKLQLVSLLAPEEILEQSMQENYGEYVSPALLEQWQQDPVNAPGRLTSSPWPDRIEILGTEKVSEEAYEVKGEIMEITSIESDEIAAKRPLTLVVEKTDGKWLINNADIGEYEDDSAVNYENTRYGFSFSLPEGWKDYQIITEKWEGLSLAESNEGEVAETGPMILIRHPEWTAAKQRQDIPIMIFTLTQWKSLEQEEFHIGAAPMGPKELARNSKYVFALPARYNYAFPAGYEEVEKILEGDALQANENIDM